MKSESIVQKIWALCHILRGDGISYHQYVSELTYLLFLKIAEENSVEQLLPPNYRWADLAHHPKDGLLGFYQEMLTHLGTTAESEVIRAIYAFPTTVFSHSENLYAVVDGISKIAWQDVSGDRFGEIYEGLIEKSSQDVRSGAGQYFTPRALVNSMVRVCKPALGELIQDPAVGSGGFLIAADRYLRSSQPSKVYRNNPPRYQGVEIEKNTRRICLMNTFLNGLDAEIVHGDALTDDGLKLTAANLVLANPPFGSKAGSRRALRADISYRNTNKQLGFLQHIFLTLRDGGRAAVVLPDNVLFEDGVGRSVRQELMATCRLHTILRLPKGIFPGAGVKTNVLFFAKDAGLATDDVWFYDLRSNMPTFGKTNALLDTHFDDFERVYGNDPTGKSKREEDGEDSRWRKLSRAQIAGRSDNLNWLWLRDESGDRDDAMEDPGEILVAIIGHLRAALGELNALNAEVEGEDFQLKLAQ
ncbi:type I restriction enzyme M protein [Sphingobium sp. JAI105]|uniref:class I SAM-dependent DNA methyltransferase n=1 Tax=Sphingobium sp. JAI105 TaxID=2787715 RepID=UPI0018C944EF|nr:N-6 DNA methylase [Sphingobium sp. JAI105]MBG6118399.1 type I restriction enzyme M protein [Sphingobium sp. JAI105]